MPGWCRAAPADPSRFDDVRVLLCEDDDRLSRGLARALGRAGYRVVRAGDVADALARIREEVPDLALVDMSLPDGSGSEVVARLRTHPEVGILIVTAHGDERQRVLGLRAGADDYVVKPFSLAELLARIEAVARRLRQLRQVVSDASEPKLARAGRVQLHLDERLLRELPEGREVQLTQKECDILAMLLAHPGAVVLRERILDQVWQTVWESSSRSLDTHMATLRAKTAGMVEIATVRGRGFRLEAPD